MCIPHSTVPQLSWGNVIYWYQRKSFNTETIWDKIQHNFNRNPLLQSFIATKLGKLWEKSEISKIRQYI
jgi:hypothetical protein